jgi:hypothetical protein
MKGFTSRTTSVVHGSPSEWRASYVGESRQRTIIGCSTGMNAKSRCVYENRSNHIKVNEHDLPLHNIKVVDFE